MFDALDSFHLLTLQGKTSAFHFYLALVHKTDNTGANDPKVSCFLWLASIHNALLDR
jgi:CxC2 like cysteine cluster associated with KDZ transposases